MASGGARAAPREKSWSCTGGCNPLPCPNPRGTPGIPIVTAPDVDNGKTVNPDFSMGQHS